MSDLREFQIRTPDREVGVLRGRLRDAVIKIYGSVNTVDAVVSAFASEDISRPLLTGYKYGSGEVRIYRYLNSGSGIEFQNWFDADRQGTRSLPDDGWRISRFVCEPPPSGVLGEAILIVAPYELPLVDFAQESNARRKYYGGYVIDAIPLRAEGTAGWTAQFVIKHKDGRELEPIGIHAYYEAPDRALEMALSQAETTIDVGVRMSEPSQREGYPT